MAERLVIEPLAPDSAHLERWLAVIGGWHHEHCLARGIRSSLEHRIEQLRKHLSPDPIPVTLVARKADQPLGNVSLMRYSTSGAGGNRVWLSNLFVSEAARGNGLGNALVERACDYAREHGEKELWLFTDDQQAFYRKRGWRAAGEARVSRTEVDILVKRL